MMRQGYLPFLLLALAACSRAPAPAPVAPATGSALPPPPDALVAQAEAPGAGAPKVAVTAPKPRPASAPGQALAAPRQDLRGRDADPAELAPAAEDDSELAKFHEEQRRRDAELLAQDAEDAQQRPRGGAEERYPRDDRYGGDERIAGEERDWRDSERYRRYAERRERYRGENGRDGYYDPRRDEGYYRDERGYEYPPDELDPYAEPEAWDEEPVGPEEDYDPRYDGYEYQR